MNAPKYNIDVTFPLQLFEIGLSRLRRTVEYAERCGVKACFERVDVSRF